MGGSTPYRMDAEGGQFCCWRLFPSAGLLCPGLLLILNDQLVSRIQLANMHLKAEKRHRLRTVGLCQLWFETVSCYVIQASLDLAILLT